jgi:hypothetical protein
LDRKNKQTSENTKNDQDNIKLDFRETGCVDGSWVELNNCQQWDYATDV